MSSGLDRSDLGCWSQAASARCTHHRESNPVDAPTLGVTAGPAIPGSIAAVRARLERARLRGSRTERRGDWHELPKLLNNLPR